MREEKSDEKRWWLIKMRRHAAQLPKFLGYMAKLVIEFIFLNLRSVSESIIRTARCLMDSCRNVEPRFIEMGDVLQAFYTDLNALIHRVKEITLKIAGTEEENLLGKATGLSREAGRILGRYCSLVSGNIESIDTLIENLKSIISTCNRIDRIATNLKVVGINIGVECTRSALTRDMFRVVSEEIIVFSNAIVSVGNQLRKDAQEAGVAEEKTREKIYSGLSELRYLSRDAAAVIQDSVSETNDCMQMAQDIFKDSGVRFEEISFQVAEIVTAVQFHDSMRQRLEHISAALTDIGQKIFSKQGILGTTVSGMSCLGATREVVALQIGQLRDIICEIKRIHDLSGEAFEKMKTEVGLLVRNISSVCNIAVEDSDSDPFVRLIDSLQHLVSLTDRADELVAVIDESITRVAQIGKRFSRHLREVEKIGVETHIMAINAIIKSNHLGPEGRTMEVLAREMNEISGETDDVVTLMKKSLNKVSEFSEILQHSSKHPGARGELLGSCCKGKGKILQRSIEEIAAAQVRIKDQVRDVASEAGRLISGIQRTLEGLVFLPALADEMIELLEELENASISIGAFDAGMMREGSSNAYRLAAAYTMKRERDVHTAVTTGSVCQPTHISASASTGCPDAGGMAHSGNSGTGLHPVSQVMPVRMEEDDLSFGDNVELF